MKNIIKRTLVFAVILTAVLALASCRKESAFDNDVPGAWGEKYENGVGGGSYADGSVNTSGVVAENRKIIKNVNQSVQTDLYDDFMDALFEEIELAGGYVSTASYSGESYYRDDALRSANLNVRIPAEKLSEFTEKVDSLAVVTSYKEYIDDVTAAYVDIESRIAVLEAEESALIDILAKSESVSDALTVRTRLLEVQSDLASLRAQKNSYDDRVEYATVTMSVSEVRRAEVQNPGFFEEVAGVFSDSLYDIGEGLRDFAVWFLGNFIYILIVAAVVVIAVLALKRLLKRRKALKSHEKDENRD